MTCGKHLCIYLLLGTTRVRPEIQEDERWIENNPDFIEFIIFMSVHLIVPLMYKTTNSRAEKTRLC